MKFCIDAAAEISRAAGRRVRYVRISRQEFAAASAASGAPEEVAWLLNYLFDAVLDGRNAHLTAGVRRALGREPTDFAEFARRAVVAGAWKMAA